MRRILDRHFYFGMALLLIAVVVYGFSHTVGESLIHPQTPPPAIFYVHAPVFFSWVLTFALQTGLIESKNLRLHRRLGYAGFAIGAVVPVLGVTTAFVSQQSADTHEFFAISLNDMLLFAVTFWLAVYWRRNAARHKRLLLICTCSMMGAAIARFPFVPGIPWAYAGVDLLILLGALRDYLAERRVHAVYCWALPGIVAAQLLALYLAGSAPPFWTAALRLIFK